jgi:hypothetical protein
VYYGAVLEAKKGIPVKSGPKRISHNMKPTTGRHRISRFGFYFGVIMLAVVVWQIERYVRSGPMIYTALPIQEKAVDAFLQMNGLITTLATTLLGAIGFLLFGGRTGQPWSRELWAAAAGAASVSVSIYYGYVAYLYVISMLEAGYFDPYSGHLLRAQYAHFYAFLVGVALFAGFVYRNMNVEDQYEHPPDVTRS